MIFSSTSFTPARFYSKLSLHVETYPYGYKWTLGIGQRSVAKGPSKRISPVEVPLPAGELPIVRSVPIKMGPPARRSEPGLAVCDAPPTWILELLSLWAQPQNDAFDDFGNEDFQRYPLEFAVGGNGDKTLKGGEGDE
jgi:hypothetical protein